MNIKKLRNVVKSNKAKTAETVAMTAWVLKVALPLPKKGAYPNTKRGLTLAQKVGYKIEI